MNRGYRNYSQAREELVKAQHALPNNARIFEFLGLIDRRQGRFDEAIRNLERAVATSPRRKILRSSGLNSRCPSLLNARV
jgi:tetratricopeptide (TPR) repeat protein